MRPVLNNTTVMRPMLTRNTHAIADANTDAGPHSFADAFGT